jgi:ribose transport system ATP-binding protein
MAVLVEFTGVPAVVVTLGASFIWLGLGIIVQPVPGGSVPSWLESGLNATFPDVPEPVYICVALALVGFLVLRRWRYGVALRGFGNSRQSYVNGGRSPLFAMTTLYLLAGLCVVGAGLFTTVVSTASDINATSTLTLGSVAAVVLGGAEFVGGVVEPIGVILAAIALGLLSSLMAFWNVNPDYVSAVEGLMLVVAMGARWIGKRASAWSS